MSTIGFARFNKQFASGGTVTPLTDAQAAAGWSFLGTSPPTVEEFNAMMQSFDDKDNWLYGNISTLVSNAGSAAPADGDFTALYKGVIALLTSGVAPVLMTGTATAYNLANAIPLTAYVNGQRVRGKVNVVNGASPTLKVDALTAIPIVGLGANVLQGGEMPANAIATFEITISASLNSGAPIAVLQEAVGGPSQVSTATASGHAVNLGQAQGMQGNFRTVLALNTNTALTASQLTGAAIDWFGPSGGALTFPSHSTIGPAGTYFKIYNYGAGTLIINASGIGSDFIYAGASFSSVTLQPGDDIEFVTRGTSEVDIVGGSGARQFNPLRIAAATAATHAVQLQQAQAMRGTVAAINGYNTTQALTNTIGGGSVQWYGAAGTLTLPAQSSMTAQQLVYFYNTGTGAVTIAHAGTDTISNTGGTNSIVLQPGDDVLLLVKAAAGSWDAISGSAVRQNFPLVTGGMSGLGGSPINATNVNATVATGATTVTITADEVEVGTALGGTKALLSGINLTLNLANSGVLNGMDTGTATASGWLGVYVVRNPTTGAVGLLGTMEGASTKLTRVYSGANPLAGFTQSYLIAILPISSTAGQFVVATVVDRTVYVVRQAGFSTTSTTNITTYTAFSFLTTSLPYSAREVFGDGSGATSGTASFTFGISPNVAGNQGSINPTFSNVGQTYYKIPLVSPRAGAYVLNQSPSGAGTMSFQANVAGFTF